MSQIALAAPDAGFGHDPWWVVGLKVLLVFVFLVVLITTWAATQYVAWQLGFQAQLGAPWFRLAGMPVYFPPAFFAWWFSYDAYAPEIFTKGAFIAGALSTEE